MEFEVVKDGKTMFYTNHKKCIPSRDEIKDMKNSGYKIYINGKIMKAGELNGIK